MTSLAIEMADGKSYGHIHKAGCRDLRDPEPLGEATTTAQATQLAYDLTGWEADEDGFHFAPCATKHLGGK